VNYYSPKRVFVYSSFQIRHGFSLQVFTRNEAWPGVTPLKAPGWGALRVHTAAELAQALGVVKLAYGQIQVAIARGERTGMHGPRHGSSRDRGARTGR
jgi:hypothetical protein